MAIVAVKRTFDETLTADTEQTDFDVSFLVEVDSLSDTIADAAVADDGTTAIPAVNSTTGAFRLKSKNVKRDPENPLVFRVTCSYSNSQESVTSSGAEKLNIDLRFDPSEHEEVVYRDRNGKIICNAAGQPFSNQPTKTYYDEAMVITFQTRTVDQTNIASCKGKTNQASASISIKGYNRTFAAGTLLFKPPRISTKVSDGDNLWDVEYIFLIREDGWKRKIIHTGRMELDDAGKLVHIKCRGEEVTEDVPLDKDGKAIIEPDPFVEATLITAAAAGEVCYSEFEIDDEASFTGLLSGL